MRIFSFCNTSCWRGYPFTIVYSWHPSQISVDCTCVDWFLVSLFYWSVMYAFMPVLFCSKYCSFVIHFEIRKWNISTFVLSQGCFGYGGFLWFCISFRNFFLYFCFKKWHVEVVENCFKSIDDFSHMGILIVLCLPIHERGERVSLCLLVSSLISFINVL